MSAKSDLELVEQKTIPPSEEPWKSNTRQVLEMVLEERSRQRELHRDAMKSLPSGTGPFVRWLEFCGVNLDLRTAREIQENFRREYERASSYPNGKPSGALTRMHLVREEVAELFELPQEDPEFIQEALQVAALLVQWVEYLLEEV